MCSTELNRFFFAFFVIILFHRYSHDRHIIIIKKIYIVYIKSGKNEATKKSIGKKMIIYIWFFANVEGESRTYYVHTSMTMLHKMGPINDIKFDDVL